MCVIKTINCIEKFCVSLIGSPASFKMPFNLKRVFGSAADKYYFNSLNESSKTSYKSKFNIFKKFLQEYKLTIYNVDESTLIAFVVYRANNNITYATIKHDLFAIQSSLFDWNVKIYVSSMQVLEKVMHGIKRTQNVKSKKAEKLPITLDILEKMFEHLPSKTDVYTQIYRSAFSIALFAMLRCGEFTNTSQQTVMRIRHITFQQNGNKENYAMKIFLPASKTDIFRQGVTLTIPCNCEQCKICPVHETLRLIELYKKHSLPCKPECPLFQFPNGNILNRNDVRKMLKFLCNEINVKEESFSGHSFRKGGATSLALNKAPDWVIQLLGRWKSSSYKRYIKTPEDHICQYVQYMIS